jgi:hypothetical protein
MRRTDEIIKDVRELVGAKGYIYALCMILFEDFSVFVEELHKVNIEKRLSNNEAYLLLGYLIQNSVDFRIPENPGELFRMKNDTYNLMEELHKSFMQPFFDELKKIVTSDPISDRFAKEKKDFYQGDMLKEPIFYSGTGAYDFQYLNFLEKKYKYDIEWLNKNKKLDLKETICIIGQIKNILYEKSKKVHLYGLKENLPKLVKDIKKKIPKKNRSPINDMIPSIELYQYKNLFYDFEDDDGSNTISEKNWESFYRNLIELFTFNKSDFQSLNINPDAFINNFSISPYKGLNSQFETIGNYNLINSHPIINIGNDKYFVPNTFLLTEAIYESPFYWMITDKDYMDQAGKNRGQVGEEITFNFLTSVFGEKRTFRSIKIVSKKGHDDTDIDVLCILGSKALCVQVKSKKLTELSRLGDDNALKDDFQKAVQNAYEQGLVSRSKILKQSSKFIDKNNNEIKISEKIDDVYIMVITTENYPSLSHQTNIMLSKVGNDPFPIALTIFDLEILTHYLTDPYDFLYYIRQRIQLMDYFIADEEIVYLGYHLERKLWKEPSIDFCTIDASMGQLIDRNFYPLKAGISVPDEGDEIKKKWSNKDFDQLCNELKKINEAKITDIIFHLFDESGNARTTLVNFIISTKGKSHSDGKNHDFSLPPDYSDHKRFGITFLSLGSDNIFELRGRLFTLCNFRKYRSKGDIWVGFGCLKNSPNMVDIVIYNDKNWEYDENLEELSNRFFDGAGKFISFGKKINRNEKCPCGSEKKFKKCCGR